VPKIDFADMHKRYNKYIGYPPQFVCNIGLVIPDVSGLPANFARLFGQILVSLWFVFRFYLINLSKLKKPAEFL